MQLNDQDKQRVIGFFASTGSHILLDGDACIVTGAEDTLSRLLSRQSPKDALGQALDMRVRKIRFAAIMQGLTGGGAYAFDRAAFDLFLPLANLYGYEIEQTQWEHEQETDGLALLTVRL